MQMQPLATAAAAVSGHTIPVWMWLPWIGWIVFITFVTGKIFHGGSSKPSFGKAVFEVVFWLAHTALAGGVFLILYGGSVAMQFFSGFVVENALSVDNILIWSAVLVFFGIPQEYRPRILAWGVYGAVILRAGFIVAGISLIHACEVVMLPLGLYLGYTAYKVLKSDDAFNAEEHWLIRLFQRRGWVSDRLVGGKFFVREGVRWLATKLVVVAVVVEFIDLLFAFDSVPVVLVVTGTTLVAWVSNMCAVLGLRALYYVFEEVRERIWAIPYGVTAVLVWIAVTTFFQPSQLTPSSLKWVDLRVPVWLNLTVIASILGGSVVWGLIRPAPVDEEQISASSPAPTVAS